MNKNKNVKRIKKFLKKHGGLMITDRQVGKSQALIELLHETPNSFILTFSLHSVKDLKERYKKQFDDGKESRIQTNLGLDHEPAKKISKADIKNSYIDEYFFHKPLPTEFLGAVSTMKFPVRVHRFRRPYEFSEFGLMLQKPQLKTEYELFQKK